MTKNIKDMLFGKYWRRNQKDLIGRAFGNKLSASELSWHKIVKAKGTSLINAVYDPLENNFCNVKTKHGENMKTTREDYPGGPCELPLKCSNCGTIITKNNVVNERCKGECEICDYCGDGKCPGCGEHWHCGGCI